MRLRAHTGAAAALLLAAMACKAPDLSPGQAAYRRAFLQGAAMPGAAKQEGRRPVEPSLAGSSDELDPATGLVRWDLSRNKEPLAARGIADGFAAGLRKADGLVRPNPFPSIPAAGVFEGWAGGGALLQSGGWALMLDAKEGLLVWTARFQGFEPVRGWRDVSALGDLKAVAMERGTLWVAGAKGAWALDISTSALRRAELPLKGVPAARGEAAADGGGLDIKALAEKGDVQAMIVVGGYAEQDGDYGDALTWYQRAAAKGDAKAMEHLAMMAALGRGGPVDRPRARQWLEQAQAAGDKDAPGLLLALAHPEKLQAP